MSRSDEELINEAREHLSVLRQHMASAGLEDQTVADAVSMRLAAAIEAVSQCSEDRRMRMFGEDWVLMWATRNRIAHGYAFVDLSIIESTVAEDLPLFEARLQREIDGDAPN